MRASKKNQNGSIFAFFIFFDEMFIVHQYYNMIQMSFQIFCSFFICCVAEQVLKVLQDAQDVFQSEENIPDNMILSNDSNLKKD